MAAHERNGLTDEWYTPAWIFEALDVTFDLDPCAAPDSIAPAFQWSSHRLFGDGLKSRWFGSVWLNPPYGGRNGIRPWLERLVDHGDGIALVPNRTGADWWQDFAERADCLLFVRGKIKFLRPDGTEGASPGYGNVLMAYGRRMRMALWNSKIRGLRV